MGALSEERNLGSPAQRPSRIGHRDGGRLPWQMASSCSTSRGSATLQTHHKAVLDLDAKAIARIKGYKFAGHYDTAHDYSGPLFFVPDDTLLLDEAACLGIHSPNDLYGGVVPYLFVKTKAITHPLVVCDAERPLGWSSFRRTGAGERVARLHRIQQPRCPGGSETHA